MINAHIELILMVGFFIRMLHLYIAKKYRYWYKFIGESGLYIAEMFQKL